MTTKNAVLACVMGAILLASVPAVSQAAPTAATSNPRYLTSCNSGTCWIYFDRDASRAATDATWIRANKTAICAETKGNTKRCRAAISPVTSKLAQAAARTLRLRGSYCLRVYFRLRTSTPAVGDTHGGSARRRNCR